MQLWHGFHGCLIGHQLMGWLFSLGSMGTGQALLEGSEGGRWTPPIKVVTNKVDTTNMVTMVWRRVFATLGGWLAGGQWVSVPQDCLQERHDEKSTSLIVSLNLRHRLLSVGGSFLVLWVGHGEEVFQLPLQCLKGRPLHRVLHKM